MGMFDWMKEPPAKWWDDDTFPPGQKFDLDGWPVEEKKKEEPFDTYRRSYTMCNSTLTACTKELMDRVESIECVDIRQLMNEVAELHAQRRVLKSRFEQVRHGLVSVTVGLAIVIILTAAFHVWHLDITQELVRTIEDQQQQLDVSSERTGTGVHRKEHGGDNYQQARGS